MLGLHPQRFSQGNLGSPHVPGPVTDHRLVNPLAPASDSYPLVVDLDLLARLEVVVNDHLPVTADESATHLDWRQPVDMVVSDEAAFEKAGEVRHVGWVAW